MSLTRRPAPPSLLATIIDSPELVRSVQRLPAPAFASLVRKVGVEDAGELLALATTPQIVAAFDEDLFRADEAGEREAFDASRFATWLEVLLEAGPEAAARRFSELSEDFVAHALSSLVLVLDDEALVRRMSEGGDDADAVEKRLESSLCEQLDGYLLIARVHEGWDGVLSLVLALDRDHRALLERVLDRCAAASQAYTEDLEALADVLSEAESLAEDAEAEREERRAARGFVEPRAAKGFLELARAPFDPKATRDATTKAYFRELVPEAPPVLDPRDTRLATLLAEAESTARRPTPRLPGRSGTAIDAEPIETEALPIRDAMQLLAERNPARYAERLEELAYLTNVITAGAAKGDRRFSAAEAADAALATVALGAALASKKPTVKALAETLAAISADLLFRRGSAALSGIACTLHEAEEALRAPSDH